MFRLIQELLSGGKLIDITLKDDNETYIVKSVDLDENLYTLIDGQTLYIAPDQIATITESLKNIDERLGF